MEEKTLQDIKLFNTETRKKEKILKKDTPITLYTCGPTVYDFAHIGNFRTYIFEDLLRRTLKFFGYSVLQVMNLTDVDDKTIKGAIRSNTTLQEYTEPYKKAFFEDIKILNIESAEFYPPATDYIDDMIKIIKTLLSEGYAYKGLDGSIYFSIEKFPSYGRLSHLNLNELQKGASNRVATDEYDKENAADFVLWKSYDEKRDGNIFWESPFGKGRPGWHIECSAMAIKILGETIDIHCGGVDNMFPHHENEIAQSEGYTKKTFVRHWIHSEHLIVDNKKMSKSLGNFFTLRNLLEKGYTGKQIRYLLLQTHYQTQLNFTFEGLEAAKASLTRISDFLLRMDDIREKQNFGYVKELIIAAELAFRVSLADDLNISAALSAIFDFIRQVNILCDNNHIGIKEAHDVMTFFHKVDNVLGLMFFDKNEEKIPQEVLDMAEKRKEARGNKDFIEADRCRMAIEALGYIIEDLPDRGSRIKKI